MDARYPLFPAHLPRRIDAADARCREHKYRSGTVPGCRTRGALAADDGAGDGSFGDAEGAKRELSVIKDTSLSGPDVDPDWKNCK